MARQAAEAYPEDPLTYALLGSASYNIGKADDATRYLEKCIALSPEQAEAYQVLAMIAYERGKPEEAVRLSREALKRGPANAETLNRLGRALLDLSQVEDAIQALKKATGLPNPMAESSYLLGQAYLQSGDAAQAKTNFLRAVGLLPDHTQAYFGLFTACLRLEQADEAARYREQFQKLEATDRKDLTERSTQEEGLAGVGQVRTTVARTLFGAAQVHAAHGQTSKAADLLGRAASFDPDSGTYRHALESVFVQGTNLVAGVAAFERLVSEQPDNTLNYFFLGRLHARLDNTLMAERCYQKAAELTPEWPESYRMLVELYLRKGIKLPEAMRFARRVADLEPTAGSHYLVAVASLRNNDKASALEAIRRAVAMSPAEAKYQQFLKRLESAP